METLNMTKTYTVDELFARMATLPITTVTLYLVDKYLKTGENMTEEERTKCDAQIGAGFCLMVIQAMRSLASTPMTYEQHN